MNSPSSETLSTEDAVQIIGGRNTRGDKSDSPGRRNEKSYARTVSLQWGGARALPSCFIPNWLRFVEFPPAEFRALLPVLFLSVPPKWLRSAESCPAPLAAGIIWLAPRTAPTGGWPYLRLLRAIGTGHHYRSEEHTSELQSLRHLVCRLLL